MVGVMVCPGVTAVCPETVSWSYRTLRGMCDLQAEAAVDSVRTAYTVGQVVARTSGRWACAEAVVRQEPMVVAGAWVVMK